MTLQPPRPLTILDLGALTVGAHTVAYRAGIPTDNLVSRLPELHPDLRVAETDNTSFSRCLYDHRLPGLLGLAQTLGPVQVMSNWGEASARTLCEQLGLRSFTYTFTSARSREIAWKVIELTGSQPLLYICDRTPHRDLAIWRDRRKGFEQVPGLEIPTKIIASGREKAISARQIAAAETFLLDLPMPDSAGTDALSDLLG